MKKNKGVTKKAFKANALKSTKETEEALGEILMLIGQQLRTPQEARERYKGIEKEVERLEKEGDAQGVINYLSSEISLQKWCTQIDTAKKTYGAAAVTKALEEHTARRGEELRNKGYIL